MTISCLRSAAGALVLLTSAGAAVAADLATPVTKSPMPAFAVFNPWMVRVRALAVLPGNADRVFAGGLPVLGGKADVSNSVVPELDISYFFTPNIAVELVLGTTPHNAKGAGTLAGLGKLGSAWLLPPTLTLQYHFTGLGAFKPYVGVGVNYTLMYGEKDGMLTNFHLRNAVGAAVQVGFDYMFNQNWGFNFDVKKLYLRTDATGLLGAAPVTAKVKLDPWLIGAGITYKF